MTLRHRHIVLVAVCAACRGAPPGPGLPVPARASSDTACTLAAGPAAARDTVTIAVTEPVAAAHAPLPRNDAERLVFAQLYETLLQLDCQGRAVPGLADAWEQSGDLWSFTLRQGARFWDGAPVTGRDIAAAWRSRDSALARAVIATGDRTFTVHVPHLPLQVFADRTLAVTKPAPGGGWPIGTGSRWISGVDPGALERLVAQPLHRAGVAAAKFTLTSPSGVRDALDGGADLLVTRDPTALEYALRLPGYVDLPLDWTRTYTLLGPGSDHPDAGELRLESLRDAVHGDARPAEWHEAGHLWLEDVKHCELPIDRDRVGATGRRHRLVYDQSDRSAADLAARLVGLGVLGRGTVAAGIPTATFPATLRAGGDAWYVVELPRRVYDVCRAALELPPWVVAGTIEPLLDVRAHAAVRHGQPRMAMDWDGTLRLPPLTP